ncbi:phytanoyl-CoA dioxygenase family protein [Gammaproteobacteria bacterium]|nr:phytanoyl-CoA dioxygenase family protein [Gammaproteobacteria bacterium]
MTVAVESLTETYTRDGFAFPIEVVDSSEASSIQNDLEKAEAELAHDSERLGLVRAYPDRLLPSFDRLIRHPKLIAAVSPLLGPDLMVWSGGLFIKEANSSKVVTWHQDLNYWGLDEVNEVTAWVALSPSNIPNGCMRFVPGSHQRSLVPHKDTFDENNLLSRGQEITVDVNDADGVNVILEPGQASLHHGHLFHASGPNTTDQRRVAAAIRFISTSMRQQTGDRTLVTLVSGEDHYGHFTVTGPPRGRLIEEDFELCRRDAAIKRQILYIGAEGKVGERHAATHGAY